MPNTPHDKNDTALREYYDRRAREYEAIYRRDDPVRQAEQAAVADRLRAVLGGRRVLEVACGTGYWTRWIAEVAAHVVATDASAEMLAIARRKEMAADVVEFRTADAYALDGVAGEFDAGAALFWLSHVPKGRVSSFLQQFHERLGAGAVVFLADSVYVPAIGGELVERAGSPDTFKRRTLADGSQHEIVKNYYDERGLRKLLEPEAEELCVHFGTCFWWLWYQVAAFTPDAFQS